MGALLYCHLAKLPISRAYDQPTGGGNYFSFTREGRALHAWRRMEAGAGG